MTWQSDAGLAAAHMKTTPIEPLEHTTLHETVRGRDAESADMFEFIERLHNPRCGEGSQGKTGTLLQPYVISG